MMSVQATPTILPFPRVDASITQMISDKRLTRKTNGFFTGAREKKSISLTGAIKIALHWRELTKQFLFTVLSGIGVLAEELRKSASPPLHLIDVLQTEVAIISDDLSNVFPSFKEVAPKGAAGSHYVWWEETVLNVLYEKASANNLVIENSIAPEVDKLLKQMVKLSKHKFGAAIQLRIVEAIALDIVLAYRVLFAEMEIKGQKVFAKPTDLSWINAHIKAEVVHHKQVADQETGLAYIANNFEEQRELLQLTQEYIDSWALALNSFEGFLHAEDRVALDDANLTFNLSQANLQPEAPVKKWRCVICDYIYDEALGIPEDGIPPGTAFADIPDDWVCIDCGVSKNDFVLIDEL